MNRSSVALLLVLLGAPLAHAQAGALDPPAYVPRYTLSVGYAYLRANAPPADCGCFSLNGAYASGSVAIKYWLSAAGEITGSHGNNIGPLGQDLTLVTYTAGPRINLRGQRFSPFAQALFGVAHGSDSYFPTATSYKASATSFALSTGGGLDIHLTHRFDLRPIEVQYLRTSLPNGHSDSQNHLVIGGGIVLKIHGRMWEPDKGRQHSKPNKADRLAARLSTPEASSSTPAAAFADTGLAPSPATSITPRPSPASTTSEQVFHDRVKDALFDYDSYVLRPDALQAIEDAALYLMAHPELHVTVGGYSDERGSAEYNLALGQQRADAARNALVAAGVPAERLRVISYGKEVQICSAEEESCYQQNRRAAFAMIP